MIHDGPLWAILVIAAVMIAGFIALIEYDVWRGRG